MDSIEDIMKFLHLCGYNRSLYRVEEAKETRTYALFLNRRTKTYSVHNVYVSREHGKDSYLLGLYDTQEDMEYDDIQSLYNGILTYM